MQLHILFGAKDDGAGRTGFNAGRLLTHGDSVRTQGAFVHLVVLGGHPWNIKRTACNTVTTANTGILIKINNAIAVLHDGPRRRTGFKAARLSAMHTAILADKPLKVTLFVFVFSKTHQRPGISGEILGVVINPDVLAYVITQIVPLHTGHLAGLTADAF